MAETTVGLRQKINRAEDLQSVVRTMKALAASSIGQYEKAVSALDNYYHAVELGLGVCFREETSVVAGKWRGQKNSGPIGAIVFGSDQGLVGQFNDIIADYAVKKLTAMNSKAQVWAVGERVSARLEDKNLLLNGLFTVPSSVKAITPLVGKILLESEKLQTREESAELYLFYNQPKSRTMYEPISHRLLPLDEIWISGQAKLPWPTKNLLPEIMGDSKVTLRALIHEYLFVSIYRACADSLASENASRLAAMQRADKNIDELLEELNRTYYRLRQSGIDEELFEVISGFEALSRTHNNRIK